MLPGTGPSCRCPHCRSVPAACAATRLAAAARDAAVGAAAGAAARCPPSAASWACRPSRRPALRVPPSVVLFFEAAVVVVVADADFATPRLSTRHQQQARQDKRFSAHNPLLRPANTHSGVPDDSDKPVPCATWKRSSHFKLERAGDFARFGPFAPEIAAHRMAVRDVPVEAVTQPVAALELFAEAEAHT